MFSVENMSAAVEIPNINKALADQISEAMSFSSCSSSRRESLEGNASNEASTPSPKQSTKRRRKKRPLAESLSCNRFQVKKNSLLQK